jgi:hypothetical protein
MYDIFKNMQDGFDNVAENSIIRMNRADVKLLATTVADILVTVISQVYLPSHKLAMQPLQEILNKGHLCLDGKYSVQ